MKKLIGRRITCEPTGRESECWGPIIHHLAGKALNDQEIASKLNLAESNVQGCIKKKKKKKKKNPRSRHNGKVGQNGPRSST